MTPAERLARQHRSPSTSETAGQLANLQPEPVNLLDAVVDRRLARVLESQPKAAAELRKEQLQAQRSRRRGEMGTRWYHCLFYPVRAWTLVAGLALVLTFLSTMVVFLLPELLDLETDLLKGVLILTAPTLVYLAVLGYACAFLNCVLISSAAGEVRNIHWPGRDFGMVATGVVTWLICLVAGPIVPAAVALWFWLHSGDPALVDKLILVELGIVSASYWLLALLSVGQSGRLRDANPLQVADLARRLGLGPLLIVFVAGALAAAHGLAAFNAVIQLHRNPAEALLWLAACWLSGMYCATFFMRYLGLKCHQIGRVPSARTVSG